MAHMHLYQVVMQVRQCQGPDAACLLAWYAWGGSIHALLRAIGGAPHPLPASGARGYSPVLREGWGGVA